MIDISFEINGRKVSPRNVGDALESAMLQSVQDSISKAVGSARCPEHGQKPKIKAKGRSLDSVTLEVTGCCDALIEQVNKKLN
ncbi:MAG: hypothetical protein ACE5EH_06745 [Gammaproteobacteria bacterium]